MTTVIDEFVVTLGLDPTQYKKQTAELERQLARDQQTALKSGKLIEDQARKQRSAFNAVKTEALGLMSVLGGTAAVTTFVNNTIKTDAAVGRLSATIGQSTRTISIWQAVMRGVGGTNADAAGALGTINQLGVDFTTGRLDAQRAGLLGQLGISASALNDPTAFSSAAAAALASSPRVSADRLRRLGFGDSYLAAIQGGSGAFQGRLAAAGPLAEITEQDAARAQALERSASRFNTAVQGRGRRALGAVLPHATTALNQLADLIEGRTAGPGFMGMPAGGRAAAAAGGGGGGGRSSFQEVYNFWRAQGKSDAVARGIAAGVGAESNFDPAAEGPLQKSGRRAYGLLQLLSADRVANFERVMGTPLRGSSAQQQLEFMAWEMQNSEKTAGDLVFSQTTAAGALSAYVGGGKWGYMRPGPGRAGDMERGGRLLTQNINIGTVVVNTQATDAKGVAAGIRTAVAQANQGSR